MHLETARKFCRTHDGPGPFPVQDSGVFGCQNVYENCLRRWHGRPARVWHGHLAHASHGRPANTVRYSAGSGQVGQDAQAWVAVRSAAAGIRGSRRPDMGLAQRMQQLPAFSGRSESRAVTCRVFAHACGPGVPAPIVSPVPAVPVPAGCPPALPGRWPRSPEG